METLTNDEINIECYDANCRQFPVTLELTESNIYSYCGQCRLHRWHNNKLLYEVAIRRQTRHFSLRERNSRASIFVNDK